MNTLKDKLKEFEEKFEEPKGLRPLYDVKSEVKQFISTAIQEALESLQGEERTEAIEWAKEAEYRYERERKMFGKDSDRGEWETASEEAKEERGWNSREKKLREDIKNILTL
jgi:hypothetical protein